MLRKALTMVAIVETLSPERLIEIAERLALDNPADCELQPWVVPGARFEGLLFLVLMWRSDTSYSTFKKFLGVIGLLALLHPRTYVDYGAELAYVDAANCEWKQWVYPGTRLVGVLYVIIALRELRREQTTPVLSEAARPSRAE
ncbi:hypothetical protein [Halegenticoccus tardaugens]|uniref:hypothetical protein n=1 Tax=Halegenticoccus tardaugens TaxID=2071624 RepID=UPI00100AF788|nr:hypothetical protein [Halegenticoccus tardaugens]